MNDFWVCVGEGIGDVFWSVFVREKCTLGREYGRLERGQEIIY